MLIHRIQKGCTNRHNVTRDTSFVCFALIFLPKKQRFLSTETEILNDSTIASDIAVVEVVEESTTLCNKLCQ